LKTVCDAFSKDATCDVVYGRTDYVDAGGSRLGAYPTESFCRERLAVANFICQPSTFFRRSVLERVGYVDTHLHYVMDYDLWIRMSSQCRFQYLDEILSHYRLHGESKTIAQQHALESSRECLDVVYKYFHWAPVNRVYGYCAKWYQARATFPLLRKRPVEFCLTAPYAFFKYCAMNRGIRLADARQLSLRNLQNLLVNRDLY
jgi:hypothetical protein